MDKETIDAYNRDSESISQLHSTLTPHRIYALIDKYFIKNGATADIGCGIGRDTHWLNQQGYPAMGVDGSEGMLKTARKLYPSNDFVQDYLPRLNHLNNLIFQNILCSAVLMHLNRGDLEIACKALVLHLNKGGFLIISIRNTSKINKREAGKLYESVNINQFLNHFKESGCEIILHEKNIEASRSLIWHNFVIKK